MTQIKLSYLTTTKNKLPYLKVGLEKLIAQKKVDEEILVADGGSTDGTAEYLAELKQAGKIDYFVSEPDFGEAHALNKLLFVSRGELISFITDDDVYSYTAIEDCLEFMLANPEIDILGSEGGSLNRSSPLGDGSPIQFVRALNYAQNYIKWKQNHTPFSFCGLGMMIRRSSLPVLGLFDPSFRSIDAEYSFRATAGKASIAWYTGYTFVNISNPQSVSIVRQHEIKDEVDRLKKFHLNEDPDSFLIQKLKIIRNKLSAGKIPEGKQVKENFAGKWPELTEVAEKWLAIKNGEKKPEFIRNK